MSALMDRACKEVKAGNKDLKEQVRHIGNTFFKQCGNKCTGMFLSSVTNASYKCL